MLTSNSNANEIASRMGLSCLKKRSCRKPKETKHNRTSIWNSVQILLIFAFVGGNLVTGIACTERSAKNSTDPGYGSIELNCRRLKGQYNFAIRKTRGLENIRTDDYQPVDPSPSSKATIGPGPIEHGTPILPYVPRYPPPSGHPKDAPPAESPGSPST